MFCKYCGNEVKDDAKFCPSCGKQLTGEARDTIGDTIDSVGEDIGKGNERLVVNDDGTFTIEINFSGDPILDVLDAQHLLFTGEGYTPLKLYYLE
jgi:hypothetical protein